MLVLSALPVFAVILRLTCDGGARDADPLEWEFALRLRSPFRACDMFLVRSVDAKAHSKLALCTPILVPVVPWMQIFCPSID